MILPATASVITHQLRTVGSGLGKKLQPVKDGVCASQPSSLLLRVDEKEEGPTGKGVVSAVNFVRWCASVQRAAAWRWLLLLY